MATHSSVLAWRIPGTGEPGGLPSMGSHRVRHDWSDLAGWFWNKTQMKHPEPGKHLLSCDACSPEPDWGSGPDTISALEKLQLKKSQRSKELISCVTSAGKVKVWELQRQWRILPKVGCGWTRVMLVREELDHIGWKGILILIMEAQPKHFSGAKRLLSEHTLLHAGPYLNAHVDHPLITWVL